MGLLTVAGVVVGGAIVKKKINNAKDKERRKTPCPFDGQINRDEFYAIVKYSARSIKRLDGIVVNGPEIHGVIHSEGGQLDWGFQIDFNDYGKITGNYWMHGGFPNSGLPKLLAETIKQEIQSYPNCYNHPNFEDYVEAEEDNGSDIPQISDQNCTQKFCSYCGKEAAYKDGKFCTFCGKPY